jgi:hypothetical protein
MKKGHSVYPKNRCAKSITSTTAALPKPEMTALPDGAILANRSRLDF